jgi:hypothetical protein
MKITSISLFVALGISGSNAAAVAAGVPSFKVASTNRIKPVWNDRGSGANENIAIWIPEGKTNGSDIYRPVATYHYAFYEKPGHPAYVLIGGDPNLSNAAIKSPVNYTLIWKDAGSGADVDGSFWRPVPPKGYVSLSDIGHRGHSMPDTELIWCLREDLAKLVRFWPEPDWTDRGSKSNADVSIWGMNSDYDDMKIFRPGFRASKGYKNPDEALLSIAYTPIPSKREGPADLWPLRNPTD